MSKKQQVQDGYEISILGRNVLVTDAMKDYAREKISKVDRFSARIINVNVTMDIVKLTHSVSIEMKVDHIKIRVQASSDDMYKSIDLCTDKLQAKLRKYKNKIRDHQAKSLTVVDLDVNVYNSESNDPVKELNDQIEEETAKKVEEQFNHHEITATEKYPLKTLTHEEAVMKMDLSDDHFLVFKCEEDQKLKVIYRREQDGNYGVIEPV